MRVYICRYIYIIIDYNPNSLDFIQVYEAGEGAVRKGCVGRQGGQIDENFEEKTKVGVCRQERRVRGDREAGTRV